MMKKYFFKKNVTGIIFLVLIGVFSFYNLRTSLPSLEESLAAIVADGGYSSEDAISAVEDTINDQVFEKYLFVEGYGYVQRLLGKNEFNNFEIVRDADGQKLYYTNFADGPLDVTNMTASMESLNEVVAGTGGKLLYLATPDKYIEGYTTFPRGMPYNYANETADSLLASLNEDGIDYLDYRTLLNRSGIAYSDLFYNTDHHWKVETSFWAFKELVNKLETDYGEVFQNKDKVTDLNNYNQITYKDAHIGSQGKKTGILYAGVDDFTFIYPKYETSFSFYSKMQEHTTSLEGRFEDCLVSNDNLEYEGKDIYDMSNDRYYSYLYGNLAYTHILNQENPEGIKVLFIKDSMIPPVAAFFSQVCGEVDLIDPRYFEGSIEEFVGQQDYDYVFVSFDPENITESFFDFDGSGDNE